MTGVAGVGRSSSAAVPTDDDDERGFPASRVTVMRQPQDGLGVTVTVADGMAVSSGERTCDGSLSAPVRTADIHNDVLYRI